ncbi:MAG: MBL fold metallo-hydrolase [Desulfobacterales bacterium]|jgi:ribonuclease Z|nr:MBL fold metallo-hydrolase [Desulfobacterales bacterium]MDD3080887.1 MBL fold metallo-hydrolase [Desulfobacterales bacterium]MDD3949820.1 MBL fold metallo-hydrolase [Desulfobacterales bacterium]MDD4463564.1 MBL fold metallo-hydrolase [Desulfobacterales bacterium]MDY0377668.1 MBL fold metallo-hydrolase [Desulfobacterales bacterium]
MRPLFHPRPVNGPFDDPGLYISFLFDRRALMFDLGDIHSLSAREALKISHVFVTHAHMDHFNGFDRLLRLCLGRRKDLYLYGPEGFLKNVEGKLAGYAWNLVNGYENILNLYVAEIHEKHRITRKYSSGRRFAADGEVRSDFHGTLLKETGFSVSAAILDHQIPCLGFSLEEHFHVNIRGEVLDSLGFSTGPWLQEFKQALYAGSTAGKIQVPGQFEPFCIQELAEKIAIISRGQKISYVADAGFHNDNAEKIIALTRDSDVLFIEAAFLEADLPQARRKFHLTAAQAGMLAAQAGVRRLEVFHFSPRYSGNENALRDEARRSFENPA